MFANKIPFQFDVVNYFDSDVDRERLAKESPINKVPILIDRDGQKIFDSRVIVTHLARAHDMSALSPPEENYLSAIYSAMDVTVNLFMLKFGGLDLDHAKNWYIDRQRARIPATLDYLSPWAESLDPTNRGHWNFPSMALFSYLFWANARGLLELNKYPQMAVFVDRFASQPGVSETDFTKL